MGVDVLGNEVIEMDEAEEAAAFEIGFNGDQEPTEEQPADEPADETPNEEPAGQEEPPANDEPAPLTVSDLQAMLTAQQQETQKLRDTLFGKIGNLQQKIESAKASTSGLSAKARERLEAEFPELAEMMFDKDEPAQDQVAYAPQTLPPMPNLPDIEEVKQGFERKLLTRDHRDWEQVVASQDFNAWKANILKPEDAAELDQSWDSDFISGKITEFKEWRTAQQKKAEVNKQKTERLAAAVTPRGVPRDSGAGYSADDEEASMMASFGKRY